MNFPAFLPDGGTIGFAAPSFGCHIEPYRSCFDAALNFWHEQGYGTLLGENVYAGEGIGISSTPEACGAELTEAYTTQESDVLISCGGGELMCETMDHVDFDRIRGARPKWFMGFSDNTNMVFLLATLCDTAAIYGPCAPAFGMNPHHQAVTDAYELLKGRGLVQKGYPFYEAESLKSDEDPYVPYNAVVPRRILTWTKETGLLGETDESKTGVSEHDLPEHAMLSSPDEAGTVHSTADGAGAVQSTGMTKVHMQGRLLGGCLDCLVNLVGTKYDAVEAFDERYAEDGIIWVLEACDLNVYSIRRALWHMDRAGWFNHVKGFLIGRPLNGEALFGLDKVEAVTGILGKYNVPILMDLDIGHLPPMMPLIIGSLAEVECCGQDLEIRMQLR